MENRIVDYKGFVITTEEGTEKGIFFRSPLQQVHFDAYGHNAMFPAYKYAQDIQNPIRRLYEILIGNGDIVKNIDSWLQELDFGGCTGNILCFPIYFKREYRKLTAYSCDSSNIKEIKSYGYESEFCECAGECYSEKTVIRLKTGKNIKIKRKDTFYFTYIHIIKDIIDDGIDYEQE